MTVGKKLHEVLAMLDTLNGEFNTFALSTDDPQAQQMFESARNQIQQIRENLNARIKYVETQEPQYRRQNMIGQQQSQQQGQMSAQGTGQTGQTQSTTGQYNATTLGSSPSSTTMSSTSNTSQGGSSNLVTSTTTTTKSVKKRS